MKTSYYTTGQFAKICEITKETLRHYNNIGIMKPEKIEENGYKYYSSHQMHELYTITILRHAGCSLEEIKSYLNEETANGLRGILIKQLDAVSIQKKELEQREDILKQSIKRFDILESHPINTIYIEEVEEEYFIVTKIKDIDCNESVVTTSSEHIQFCEIYKISTSYQYSYIMQYNKVKNTDYIANKITSKVKTDIPLERVHVKNRGTYLKYIHKGIYDMDVIHGKIREYAYSNEISLANTYYESEVSIYREEYKDYIIEISVEIIE